MRLVKKTVNQDDPGAYHLFYADKEATPGSDLTFFDWPVPRETRGTNSITRTALRVAGEGALAWWSERLKEHGVTVGASSSATGGRPSTSRIPRASACRSSTTAARARPIPGRRARFRPSARSAGLAR